MPRILVVDDDRETCRFMRELLSEEGREIEMAESAEEALARLDSGRFELVLSDIHLDAGGSGLDLLRAFKSRDPAVEVVLISAFGTLETALEAVDAGAFDFVSKPVDIAQVRDVVARALARRARAGEPRPAAIAPGQLAPDGLVGRSGGMLAVYKQIALACSSASPVLVVGETGTGKELVARAVHRHGPRGSRPFVPVNCGALPEGLLESELFGHVRGAFTGAVADKKGLFEQAHGGTIFLDEIGEMSPAVQVRLLRALELGEVRPLGGSRVLTIDARVIAATHRELERAAREGTFRQDLFYRLNVLTIRVPPLRERPRGRAAARPPTSWPASPRAATPRPRSRPPRLAALAAHDWPGNVRELENTLERLAVSGARRHDRRERPPGRVPRQAATARGAAVRGAADARRDREALPAPRARGGEGQPQPRGRGARHRPADALPHGRALRARPGRRRAALRRAVARPPASVSGATAAAAARPRRARRDRVGDGRQRRAAGVDEVAAFPARGELLLELEQVLVAVERVEVLEQQRDSPLEAAVRRRRRWRAARSPGSPRRAPPPAAPRASATPAGPSCRRARRRACASGRARPPARRGTGATR